MKNDFSFLVVCMWECMWHAKCIWSNRLKVARKVEKVFMAFYYKSDKLLFFVTRVQARCHFSDAHFIIYCNLYAGENFFFCIFGSPHTTFIFIDSSISGFAKKKLVYTPNCWRCIFFLYCSTVVFFTFSANTYSHVHQHRQYSPTHFLFQSFFSCISALHAFFPRVLFDSLMVKWLYGLVWSVVCYFNFLCLLLTALGWCCGDE